MFEKDTYIRRRAELKKLVQNGVIIFFGNNESPCNFPNNGIILSDKILRFFIILVLNATDWLV